MGRKILIVLSAVLLSTNMVLAWGGKKKEAKPQAVTSASKAQAVQDINRPQEKEALIADINNMRNQEIRVAVLGQLLNEEIAKLRNVQAVFCGKYKLDLEKFRQGLYRYDEQQGKFVETPAASAPAATAAPAKTQ